MLNFLKVEIHQSGSRKSAELLRMRRQQFKTLPKQLSTGQYAGQVRRWWVCVSSGDGGQETQTALVARR